MLVIGYCQGLKKFALCSFFNTPRVLLKFILNF